MNGCCSQGLFVNGQPAAGSGGTTRLYAFSNAVQTSNVPAVVTSFGSFAVAANDLPANGSQLHLAAGGDFVAVAGKSITFGLSMGATAIAIPSIGAIAGSAQRRPWHMSLRITRITAATGRVFGEVSFQANATAPAAGLGTMAGASLGGSASSAVADFAIDWTVNNTFDIVYFQSATGVGDDMTRRIFSVERLLA